MDKMGIVWILTLGGIVLGMFAWLDQDLCIEPCLKKNEAYFLGLIGIISSTIGLVLGAVWF